MPDKTELVEAFRSLGITDPEGWAASEVKEGIPQLARATLLVELARIVEEATGGYVGYLRKDPPTPELPAIYDRIRDAGISDADLVTLMRFVSSLVVFDVCALLDGSRTISANPGRFAYSLAIADDDPDRDDLEFQPVGLGLHESWGEVATTRMGKSAYWW